MIILIINRYFIANYKGKGKGGKVISSSSEVLSRTAIIQQQTGNKKSTHLTTAERCTPTN